MAEGQPSDDVIDGAFGGCPLSEREEGCCGNRLDCASREQLKAEVERLRGIIAGIIAA